LLCPIVQIPLDPAASFVSCGGNSRPRRFHLAQPQPVRDVLERDHRAPAVVEVDRCRRVRDRDLGPVLADEPVLLDADRLPSETGTEERAFFDRKGGPVGAKVVDAVVAGLSEQILLFGVAEDAEGSWVEEGDSSIRVDDVQRVCDRGDSAEERSFVVFLRSHGHARIVAPSWFGGYGASATRLARSRDPQAD